MIKNLPLIYLEGYSDAKKLSKNNNWPQDPKYIYSSNAFIYDDIFKFWLAEKKENFKTKFISGQHGGVFFISKTHFHEDHQKSISDNIVTWGYSEKNNYFKPLYNFIIKKNKFSFFSKSNKILFIQYSTPRFSTILNSTYAGPQHAYYIDEQLVFLNNLNKNVLDNIVIRPYHFDFGWKNIERFQNVYPNIKIDNISNIYNSFKNTKLVVSTLNGTSFLESLSLNLPTIIFFNKNYDQINNNAKSYFKVLEEAGIFFSNPELASIHINKIFNNIDMWWKSHLVQAAVNHFCNRFSRRSKDPLKDMANIFSNI